MSPRANQVKQHRVLIMAGGTGGHVFPALAVADELAARGLAVSWLGTAHGLEARVVPAAGYPLETIRVFGVRGKGLVRLLLTPFMLLVALVQSSIIVLRLRPRMVLGMGGFSSGPGAVVSWLLRCPLLIHEQNSVAGLTNRLLAPLAQRVMEAFPGSLPAKHHVLHTGNPVRRDILGVPAPVERFAGRSGSLRILVVGGSLGARVLNETLPAALVRATGATGFQVHHQTGRDNRTRVEAAYRLANIDARVDEFVNDMAAAYAWADLVVCRAGALTIAELSVVGVASILVPFPFATDDHQTGNAHYLADAGAAILVPQGELNTVQLADLLTDLAGQRDVLLEMACRARELAIPDAARRVARLCLEAGGLEPDGNGEAIA